jgi:hypothetical protein
MIEVQIWGTKIMASTKYWALVSKKVSDGAVLSDVPDEGPSAHHYRKGVSLLDGYPKQEDAVMCMSPNQTDGIKLYDIVDCESEILVVNSKVKAVLDEAGATDIEYLPVTIWDHTDKPCSTDYFILNALSSYDIIDIEGSEVVMNSFFPTRVNRIKMLKVDYNGIPEDAKLFRASKKMGEIFVSDKIATALRDAEIKGCVLMEAEGWDGFDF